MSITKWPLESITGARGRIIRVCCNEPDICFKLPHPISVNNLYASTRFGRRKKVSAWYSWYENCNRRFISQGLKAPKFLGDVFIIYEIPRDSQSGRRAAQKDAANFEKSLSDILVKWEFIKDDTFIFHNHQTWAESGNEVIVSIWDLSSIFN